MIADVRSAVGNVRFALKKQAAEPDRALEPAQLDGWCELAEAIAYHQLAGHGYELHSNQVEELGGAYRHAFLIARQGSTCELVDPTFGQFLHKQPGQSLQTSGEGRLLLQQLLEDGHAAWTSQTARIYAQAFQIQGPLYEQALHSNRPMLYQPILFQSLLPD